ncbi:hypothetical protein JR334_06955 [Clostridia bacterium]|nr:hypothetical protein JR334_06955 [Clostridia bacterium]
MTKDQLGFDGRELIVCQAFFSIKNQVYLVLDTDKKKKVLKIFQSKESLVNEKENLHRFSTASPQVLEESDGALLMEYIPGSNLLDLYIELEKSGAGVEKLASQIKNTLQRLYDLAPGYRLGDMNLRNFILDEKTGFIRFVDYEESCLGKKEEDAGRLLAFLLTYRPIDTNWKRSFVVFLAKQLVCSGQDAELIRHYALDELQAISRRRNIPMVYLPLEFPRRIS